MMQQQILKANLIQQFRERAEKNDTPELQQKRIKFLDWLNCQDLTLPKVLEMYQAKETIYGKKQVAQYFKEYKFANTRTQIIPETRAEIDKLEFEKAIDVLCEIMLSLIRKKIHFAVFYAEGQRSPHIIIYDFDELLKLSSFQRTKAKAKFWRWVMPFSFHYLDQALFDDEHYVPLEFALHWKYGTPFNLLFEYLPQEELKNATTTT